MALLELAGVTKRYILGGNEVTALDGVDLAVDHGESLALVGRSGSGKSTLLHLAGGLDKPDAGSVRLDGRDLATLSVGERARLRRTTIGFIFQFFHLVPGLSVAENVEGQVADAIADRVDTQFASFRVMQRALLAVLFVAVHSSLTLAGVQRRQELGLLGAVGAEPASLARLLLVEAGLVAGAGVALSVVVGPLMLFALNQILPFVVGFWNPVTFDWPVLVSAGALSVVVALLGAAWPARRAARVEVLEALRYE